jgi:hypothetical protein
LLQGILRWREASFPRQGLASTEIGKTGLGEGRTWRRQLGAGRVSTRFQPAVVIAMHAIHVLARVVGLRRGPLTVGDCGEKFTFTSGFSFSPYRQLKPDIATCAIYRVKKKRWSSPMQMSCCPSLPPVSKLPFADAMRI